jgi:hypothetical protein
MTTNFSQWNPGAANQETDATYASDGQRVGGAVSGAFDAVLANKLFYQASTFFAAFAHMLSTKGYSPVDGTTPQTAVSSSNAALLALATVLGNVLTNADIPFTFSVSNLAGHINFGSWMGNLKVQWGSITITNPGSPQSVSFPVSFTTNTPMIMLTPTDNISPFVTSPALADFGAEYTTGSGSHLVYWLAIGI